VAIVAIALGSNLGNRQANVEWAIDRLARLLAGLRASSIIETEPVDVPDEQPRYLNAAVVGQSDLGPQELLHELTALEAERGRTRPSLRAARTLDIDLILYGDRVIETPELQVPHPRFRNRLFVLEPLVEIAPALIDPVTRFSTAQLLTQARLQLK
jgi:2-amino-4-hydroxy-6-hydroxymethyldihydropteridine diphosphokinase